MSVVRVNKTKDYTVMSNEHLRDKNLSLKAKGLLSLMLSLPDDWDYSILGLTTFTKDGKDAITSILKELEDNRYLIRTKLINDKGQFAGYDYNIFEKPQTEKPYPEKPNTDNPNTENPTLLNTNIHNTDIQNTNNKYNNEISEVIEYLNTTCFRHFKPKSESIRKVIRARLEEDYTVDDLKRVIDLKASQWLNNPRMEQYLRPDTLFNKTKFANYYGECSTSEVVETYGTRV